MLYYIALSYCITGISIGVYTYFYEPDTIKMLLEQDGQKQIYDLNGELVHSLIHS